MEYGDGAPSDSRYLHFFKINAIRHILGQEYRSGSESWKLEAEAVEAVEEAGSELGNI